MGCYRTGMAIGMGAWDWIVCVVGGLNAVRFLVRWWDLLCGELVRRVVLCWVGGYQGKGWSSTVTGICIWVVYCRCCTGR